MAKSFETGPEQSSRTVGGGYQSAGEPFVPGSWLGGIGKFRFGEIATRRLELEIWRRRSHRDIRLSVIEALL
jgi:hypothetical protein